MQTYFLDLKTLLTLLADLEQSGELSTELPPSTFGTPGMCRATIILRDGNIIFCQIEERNRQVIDSGSHALQRLFPLNVLEWHLQEISFEQSPALTPQALSSGSTTAPLPSIADDMGQKFFYAVPQRTRFIDWQTLGRLSRQQRRVLNLVDGERSIERIAFLLFSSSDLQSVQQVRRLLDELAALGMILFPG